MVNNKTLKICLASSSGGHLSQLLKLANSWTGNNIFFVTTTKVVQEKLSSQGRVYVVGECNRQHPLDVLKVLTKCIKIIIQEKPEVVLSTGAAAGCIMCFLGKITGAKIIWVDSITNVERLSFSGRMVRYIADLFLVQWPDLTAKYKKNRICREHYMIFLTVGTQFAFDRLVKGIDEAIDAGGITEEIYAQIGESCYIPRNFEAVKSLEKNVFDKYVHHASYIVSHAGMGTITMALDNNKPLLVMPRQKKYGEVVNDHQVAIARKFEQFGHILAAYKQQDLPDKIMKLKSFVPQPRSTSAETVINRISQYLTCLKAQA